MGHLTLKRVPLDFAAPLNKVWKGYINPHPGPRECKTCEGTGYNPATKQIADDFYDLAGHGTRWRYNYGFGPDGSPASQHPWQTLGECRAWHADITQDEVEELVAWGRLSTFTHVFVPGDGWKPKSWETKGFWCPKCRQSVPQLSLDHHTGFCTCTGEETPMKLLEGDDVRLHIPMPEEVNNWEKYDFPGHDGVNRGILVRARAKRLRVYGRCPRCRGKGELKLPRKAKKRYKKWQEYEPPTGEGYQLWETTTEGSPIGPVFGSAEALADWCAENSYVVAREKTSRESWLKMFVEEGGLEVGSCLVRMPGFVGAVVNAPL